MAVRTCVSDLFPPYPQEDWRHHCETVEPILRRVLAKGVYVLGEEVRAFEQSFASWLGMRHALGVASGTDAIEVILRALNIGPSDLVVVPSFCVVAVAAAVVRSSAGVLFADIDPRSMTLCPRSLEALLQTPSAASVKAVIAVHLFGQPVAWDELQRVADARGVVLLEDGAQAHGAIYRGRNIGSLGRAAAFSFYPTKNLGAIGDGGAVVTSDAVLAARAEGLRQYGWCRRYVSEDQGINSRLDELQAAVLRVKLADLSLQIERRRQLADLYAQGLRDQAAVVPPVEQHDCRHAWHLYVVRSRWRDALMQQLELCGIPTTVHYPLAIHQQPAFRHVPLAVPLPESERAVQEVLSLPLHPYLSVDAIDCVAQAIRQFTPSTLHAAA